MTKGPPARAEDIFYDLLSVEPAGRVAAIDAACAGDDALRAEVQSLLDNHKAESDFLDSGGVRALAGVEEIAPLSPGARVAGYTVKGVVGAGGMGVVYIAEQDRPRRTVALKLVRRSASGLLRRFEREAEVLGRLQHPGIAQIYEAGATTLEGRGATPYIAMELVQGQILTEHARHLPVRERLELIAKVCDGVQHAHQRGVIHRDLKPANILVEAQGQPKVLDFGVARAAGSDLSIATAGTGIGQIVGTLQYMSPEQVRADPGEVDTRSDIYALGVILFQVLTGRLPHDLSGKSLPEAARLIGEVPAPRVGAIDRTLRGDVETIVAKALEKDKDRRYRSAADLAEDIRRFLSGQPIMARNDSALYMFNRQLRRHIGAVVAAAASIVALAGFAVYATVQSSRNERLARLEAKATVEALDSLKAAKDARGLADQTAERLKAELATSTIERGRLLGRTGNLAAAEGLLWPAHLKDPSSRQSHWALWELYAHEPCLATVSAHESPDQGMAMLPDGRTMYTAGPENGGTVKRWDTTQARPEAELESGFGTPVDLAVSGDGKVLAGATGEGAIVLWDTSTGRIRRKFTAHIGGARTVAFSPDGSRLVSGGDDKLVRIWDTATGTHVGDMISDFKYPVTRVAWSPDGAWIASGAGTFDGRIMLWNGGADAPRVLTGHTMGIASLAFSADSRMLASGSGDRDIRLWNVPTGTPLGKLVAPNGTLRAVQFTADNKTLVSAGWWSIDLWDLASRRKTRSLSLLESTSGMQISADGTLVVAQFLRGVVQFWDLKPSAGQLRLAGHSGRVAGALSPDGRLAATGDQAGVLRFWEGATGALLATVPAHAGRIKAVKFSPDGQLLATGAEDGIAKLWDLRTGSVLGAVGRHAATSPDSVCFSPDGRLLAVARADSSISLLMPPGLVELSRFPGVESEIVSLSFSPDGQTLAAIARDRITRLWPMDGGGAGLLTAQYLVSPWCSAFTTDGSRLVIGDWARDLQVWDLASSTQKQRLHGHSGLVTQIQIDPADPQIVASAAADGAVRLWDLSTGLTLATLDTLDGWEAICVCLSQDGRRLLETGAAGEAVIWDLTYFDRHIASNADFQISHLAAEIGGPTFNIEQARAWAAAAKSPRPAATAPSGVAPETVLQWGQESN